MSYRTKMRQEIKKDIEKCNELLKKEYVEGKDFSDIKAKYGMLDSNFYIGFKSIASSSVGKGPNQIENLKILKSKLDMLMIEIENPSFYNNSNVGPNIILNNSNNNSNINENFLNVSIDDIRNNIGENTCLSDIEKEQLKEKLDEIEKLQNSKDSKVKKWVEGKEIIKFVLDKGVDIAIMYLPQIWKALL